MTGKEKALYVSSGTQSNLCGLLSTCWERGSEIFIGDKSHIALYEQGSVLKILALNACLKFVRVRIRWHDFVRVHVRVRVRSPKKSRVHVRIWVQTLESKV